MELISLATIAGYFGTAMFVGITVFFGFKYNEVKSLKNTIETLKLENESLKNLLEAKDKMVLQVKSEIETIKSQLNRQAILFEGKFQDVKRELEELKRENELHKQQALQHNVYMNEYRSGIVKAIQHCEVDDCKVCEELETILMK